MNNLYNLDKIVEEPKISAEYVLSKIDDVLIFRYYIGEFQLGRPIKSPFKYGTRPNFSITFNSSWMKLMWKCFHSNATGDAFLLVAKLYNLNYFEAVRKVSEDFGLVKGLTISKKQIEEAKQFKESFRKKELLIQVDIRKYTREELEYWNQYTITKQELINNGIFSISKMWINKEQVFLDKQLRFAYYFKSEDKWKIYTPYNNDYKWFGNISALFLEGIDTIDFTKPIVVTKSKKDKICLKKIYSNVINTQNESETAIPLELDKILDKCPSKYIIWDSDPVGVESCKKLNKRGYKYFNVPKSIYQEFGTKDVSDLIRVFKFEKAQEIILKEMKKKGLWE